MAKKLISPGVLTNEIDASFLPAALGAIGAAVVGPASKGPVLVPTIINNKRELEATFGGLFTSGSNRFEYLTTLTAKKILQTKGPVLFTRVASGSTYSPAVNGTLTQAEIDTSLKGNAKTGTGDSGSILSSVDADVIGNGSAAKATGSFTIAGGLYSTGTTNASMSIGATTFIVTGSGTGAIGNTTNTATQLFVPSGSNVTETAENFRNAINSSSIHGLSITSNNAGGIVELTASIAGNMTDGVHVARWYGGGNPGFDNLAIVSSSKTLFTSVNQLGGGTDNDTHLNVPFKLHTLVQGSVLNSRGSGSGDTIRTNGTLLKGTSENIRWEISDVNNSRGTFALNIRAGNDSEKRKNILEKFSNLSLDPTSQNYIEKVVGSQTTTLQGSGTTEPYVKVAGDFPNKSKFIRVEVFKQLPNYLDENGNLPNPEFSASLPAAGSGSLGGGFVNGSDGEKQNPQKSKYWKCLFRCYKFTCQSR